MEERMQRSNEQECGRGCSRRMVEVQMRQGEAEDSVEMRIRRQCRGMEWVAGAKVLGETWVAGECCGGEMGRCERLGRVPWRVLARFGRVLAASWPSPYLVPAEQVSWQEDSGLARVLPTKMLRQGSWAGDGSDGDLISISFGPIDRHPSNE